MFIVYIRAELSFLSSRSPLIIANGPNYEENAHTAAPLLHVFSKYELQKKNSYFLYIICYRTLFHYLYVSVANVISASKFRTSAMLLVPNVGN